MDFNSKNGMHQKCNKQTCDSTDNELTLQVGFHESIEAFGKLHLSNSFVNRVHIQQLLGKSYVENSMKIAEMMVWKEEEKRTTMNGK